MKLFQTLAGGIREVVFPNVCVCCGLETTSKEREICSFCLVERFEERIPGQALEGGDILMPEGVLARYSMWNFDKGGRLQDLLHYLKYERLTQIGFQLGERLGLKSKNHPVIGEIFRNEDCILVPVPLHYLKFRYRGFNQAFAIASGVQRVSELPICGIRDVVRTKNTRSQTGLTMEKRMQNIEKAFRVRNREVFEEKYAIIVDDVFTTGATTFELSGCLLESGAKGTIILTIAQA